MEATMERRSNLVMPTIGYELDREEMSYVDGGIYLSYNTLVAICGGAVTAGAYAVASVLTLGTAWLNTIPGGTIIWALLGVSSLILGIHVISALSQRKGLDISLSYTKIWFIPIPTGLSLKVC